MEKMTTYTKNGGKWEKTNERTDKAIIYEFLAQELIAKKINCCKYIRKIERVNRYDGFARVTVYYDNGVKNEYIIKAH